MTKEGLSGGYTCDYRWFVVKSEYGSSDLVTLLKDGWEPFAVVHSDVIRETHVFLRKKMPAE